MNTTERIGKAIEIAVECGRFDGSHHKMWVIDQMLRILTDCPIITRSATDAAGRPYTYEAYGENDAYRQAVNTGDQHWFAWDVGVAP
ncbi:hypothetical protein [Nonomuraea typhae]|uniref:hypothetical protein n=1 Tax=Nonomuraea typhae TaxID=2603600 RepID=UPI0012FCCF2B|nr:hypothetical protein [Nonomuraea typhae]